ncbi:MAG: murein biosynthesis integral membrane protein MurJ [Gammaproteobacteria bacterium]|nr:murein biosynthesis integral membrane protein MurJ [Gammaproteobacteria bacterium]MCF6258968.1 murein biosynthesis integral membrane protein MurJ [Gammaproteobacteria bacterium]
MSRRLLKSTGIVSAMTTLSRVLGLVRDVVFAQFLGAGGETDAFFVAFKIPNFLRRLFAEGAFAQAFVPVLTEYKTQRSEAEVRNLVQNVAGTLGGILFVLTVLAAVVSPVLVMLFAPGFIDEPERFDLTAEMLRITFPYLLFISMVALAGSILNAFGRFAVPAFTPVFLNVVLIGVVIWAAPHFEKPVVALAWGVFIAGIVQLLFQLPFLKRLGLLVWPKWGVRDEGVRRIGKLMLPAIFGSSVAQINLLFDTIIASFLVAGSVSWLYYSDRLVEFPLGVFGIALATVILPSLSQKHAASDPAAFSRTLDWALRWVLVVGAPATVGLFVLSGPILTTLFHYGAFDVQDVDMARLSLMAYSLGLLGFIGVKVLAPGYYARQNIKTPVRIGIIAMVINMGLNVIFVVPMVMFDIEGPHSGLALATACSAFINAGLLFRGLRKEGVLQVLPGWGLLAARVLIASLLMAAVLIWGTGDLSSWLQWGLWQRVEKLVLWVSVGGVVYFGALLMMGIKVRELMGRAK